MSNRLYMVPSTDTETAMLGVMWLGLPDTPDKNIGMTYLGVVSCCKEFEDEG